MIWKSLWKPIWSLRTERTFCTFNGDGFEEEQLKQLNDMHSPAPKDGKHIGIHNIKHRLLSIYGENARLLFSNHEEGGARIDFWIP